MKSKSKKRSVSKSKSPRPIPESAREYLQFIGSIGGSTSRRDLAANQARRMVAIREAKRALIKQGKPELTWDRWPLKVKAEYTKIGKPGPRIGYEVLPGRIKHGSRS